jgi:hypothetical protein
MDYKGLVFQRSVDPGRRNLCDNQDLEHIQGHIQWWYQAWESGQAHTYICWVNIFDVNIIYTIFWEMKNNYNILYNLFLLMEILSASDGKFGTAYFILSGNQLFTVVLNCWEIHTFVIIQIKYNLNS